MRIAMLLSVRLQMDIKNAKESYYRSKFDNSSTDIKSQWNIINDLIGENLKRVLLVLLKYLVHDV